MIRGRQDLRSRRGREKTNGRNRHPATNAQDHHRMKKSHAEWVFSAKYAPHVTLSPSSYTAGSNRFSWLRGPRKITCVWKRKSLRKTVKNDEYFLLLSLSEKNPEGLRQGLGETGVQASTTEIWLVQPTYWNKTAENSNSLFWFPPLNCPINWDLTGREFKRQTCWRPLLYLTSY